MKGYISSIIDRIRLKNKKLDDVNVITNHQWVLLDDSSNKITYIFRNNGELLISTNGIVRKAKWQYLNDDSLLIEDAGISLLLKHMFYDKKLFILQVDGINDYMILIDNNIRNQLIAINQNIERFLMEEYSDIETELGDVMKGEYTVNKEELINDLNPVKNSIGKYGFLDKTGNVVIPFEYDVAHEFIEDRALVMKKGKGLTDYYGFVDLDGNIIAEINYDYAEDFSEGFALVRKNDHFGHINLLGEIAIPIIYEYGTSFKHGFAEVTRKGTSFWVDSNGNRIVNKV